MKIKILALGLGIFSVSQASYSKPFPLASEQFEFCFRPFDDCEKKYLDFLSSAVSSIDIAAYQIDHPAIYAMLKKKLKEGVKVSIVADGDKLKKKKSLVPKLHDHGAAVRVGVQQGHMHNKFTIIDNKVVETGSSNFTLNSYEKNQENTIYSSHQELAATYSEYFQRLWKSSAEF